MSCAVCGEPFVPKGRSGLTQRYCSIACRNRRPRTRTNYRRPRGVRTCPTCERPFEWYPRDRTTFCSRQCSNASRPGARIDLWCLLVISVCVECGLEELRPRQRRYCSERCESRYLGRAGYKRTPPRTKTCVACGTTFTRQGRGAGAYTCSSACSKRWAKRSAAAIARNRRKRDEREQFIASGEKFANWEIYVRDNWICHICGKRIPRKKFPHPLSPTIDHLVPVNGPEKGEHTRKNVRAAHFICNAKRREVGPAQLILFGEIAV